jgi:hypothetical protein
VPDEAALRHAASICSLNDIRQYLFIESDLGDQATAFATEPICGDMRKAFKKFPLWKPEYEKVA